MNVLNRGSASLRASGRCSIRCLIKSEYLMVSGVPFEKFLHDHCSYYYIELYKKINDKSIKKETHC
jgi:hypothetical protein